MILHVARNDKFIPPFIDFLEEHFDDFITRHEFWISGDKKSYPIVARPNINFPEENSGFIKQLELARRMQKSEKIILHGLFDISFVKFLSMQPWLLKKCYWVIWGKDLYSYKLSKRTSGWYRNEVFRRIVIKRFGHLVTYVEGDVNLARQWYGAKGQYHECLMYSSNLYKAYDVPHKEHTTINILVGNSADHSNNHLEVFEKLIKFKEQNIKIYVPLSYGDQTHVKTVLKAGREIFGDKFIPLLEFMPFQNYLALLGEIDIAVFAHKRQQAMGNTITLLGLGKKVYMRDDVTPLAIFSDLGIKVFDVKNLDLTPMTEEYMSNNIEIIKANFSEGKLLQQLRDIFTREADHVVFQR